MEIFRRAWKTSGVSENFGNTLKSVSEGFLFFLKLFGNVLKFWENFEIGS